MRPCDEPSIGLSPNLVHEVFVTLQKLRDSGVTVLMVEQNGKAALAGLFLSWARPGCMTEATPF